MKITTLTAAALFGTLVGLAAPSAHAMQLNFETLGSAQVQATTSPALAPQGQRVETQRTANITIQNRTIIGGLVNNFESYNGKYDHQNNRNFNDRDRGGLVFKF